MSPSGVLQARGPEICDVLVAEEGRAERGEEVVCIALRGCGAPK